MIRGKNGRFSKKKNIEIPISSPFSVIKSLLVVIIFLPWLYILIFRFEISKIVEEIFFFLLGDDEKNCPSNGADNSKTY